MIQSSQPKIKFSHTHTTTDALLDGVGGARLVLELDKRETLDATLLAILCRRMPRQRQRLDRAAHTGGPRNAQMQMPERMLKVRKRGTETAGVSTIFLQYRNKSPDARPRILEKKKHFCAIEWWIGRSRQSDPKANRSPKRIETLSPRSVPESVAQRLLSAREREIAHNETRRLARQQLGRHLFGACEGGGGGEERARIWASYAYIREKMTRPGWGLMQRDDNGAHQRVVAHCKHGTQIG